MPNTLTARNMEIGLPLKEYIGGKVDRLRKIFDNIQKIEVILSVDKREKGEADLIVESSLGTLKCAAKDETPQSAFDVAMDKMERQLSRHKSKIIDRKKRRRETPRKIRGIGAELEDSEAYETVAAETLELPHPEPARPDQMSLREALDRFERAGYEAMVYRDEETDLVRVLFRDDYGHNRLLEIVDGVSQKPS